MPELDAAAVAPRGHLEPRQGVDGGRVRLDAAHVAEDDVRPRAREVRAHPVAEPWEVVSGDRLADGEGARPLRFGGHRGKGPPARQKIIVPAAMSSGAHGGRSFWNRRRERNDRR